MKLKNLVVTIAAVCGFFIAQDASATCSNYSTFTDGQVLTAGALNGLQSNYTTCVNAVLDGDTFTGNMLWYGGSDILMYSDSGTTKTAEILGNNGNLNLYSSGNLKVGFTASTGAATLGLTRAGQTSNCGLFISGSTVTIKGYEGTSLSTTNPCIVSIPNQTTVGAIDLAYFTANVSFTVGAASDTDGNTFGLTSTANNSYTSFFIGVLHNGTSAKFTLSRAPYAFSGAATADVCQKGDTDCDDNTDIMLLDSGLTLTDWDNGYNVTNVGWLYMTYTAAGLVWDVTDAAADPQVGFNDIWQSSTSTISAGQFGATSGKFFTDGAGTAPVFGNNSYASYIDKTLKVTLFFQFTTDGGTDGATAGNLQMEAPFRAALPAYGSAYILGPSITQVSTIQIAAGGNDIIFYRNSSATAATTWLNTDFPNGNREVRGSITYYMSQP